MKKQPGTNANRRYWQRLRSNPKACPGGDCLCDMHEGVTDRLMSRALQTRALPGIIDEFDFDLDDGQDYCGDWCPCGSNFQNWTEWLRDQELYPPAPLSITVLMLYTDN